MKKNKCRDCPKLVTGYYLCGLCYYKRIRDGKNTYFPPSEESEN